MDQSTMALRLGLLLGIAAGGGLGCIVEPVNPIAGSTTRSVATNCYAIPDQYGLSGISRREYWTWTISKDEDSDKYSTFRP